MEATKAELIPAELRERRQWFTWRFVNGQKIPRGKTNDPSTWTSFTEIAGEEKIAFIISADDDYVGIDLDGALDESGTYTEWAAEVLDRFIGLAYAEVSPSGKGVKLLTRAHKPEGSRCVSAKLGDGKSQIECYDHARFWTITGDVLKGFETIHSGQAAVDWLVEKYLSRGSAPRPAERSSVPQRVDYSDDTLVARGQRYADAAEPASEGQRNGSAFRLAGHIYSIVDKLGQRLTEADMLDLVRGWNARNNPPLPDVEIQKVVASARRNGTPPPDKLPTLKNGSNQHKSVGPSKDEPTSIDEVEKPTVIITIDENDVAEQVITALAKFGGIYVRSGSLTVVVEDERKEAPPGSLRIMPLPTPIVRERIGQSCELMHTRIVDKKTELVRTTPPKWLVDAVDQRGFYGRKVPSLSGILRAPAIRKDGSILQTPGYDYATGLFYSPSAKFPGIPENPSREDAIEAANKLLDLMKNFPFPSEADRAAWLSIVLTLVARPCIDGCCPLFAISANVPGAGKTLAMAVAWEIAFGTESAARPFIPNEDEMRKLITTCAVEAVPAFLFDNLAFTLSSSSLDAALTSRVWRDRILGSTKSTGELSLDTVWLATGNNIVLGSDIARRVILINLQSELENPEERNDFEHKHLLSYVRDHRAELAVAALTIVRAFYVAGCPEAPGGEFGSFEQWSRVIRSALVWVGVGDPLLTRLAAKGEDETKGLLKAIIYGLLEADPDREGLTTKQLERLATHKPDEPPSCPTLLEAIAEVCGPKFSSKVLAFRLRSFKGRIVDGMRLKSASAGKGVKKWLVEYVQGGLGGLGGFVLGPCATRGKFLESPQKLNGLETNPPNPPKQPSKVCSCGSEMIPGEVIGNELRFRNWDCPVCRTVIAEEVTS